MKMTSQLSQLLLLLGLVSAVSGKTPVLPPCPTGIQYNPGSLPMHCRLVKENNGPYVVGIPGQPGNAMPLPMPFPGMPNMPNMPNFPNMPGMGMPGMRMGMPGMPGMMPGMAIPYPGAIAMGPPKLPVIVMPIYTPGRQPGPTPKPDDTSRSSDTDDSGFDDRKLNKHRLPDSSDTDSHSLDRMPSSDDEGFWNNKRSGRKSHKKGRKKHQTRRSQVNRPRRRHNRDPEQLLTPVIQYVTKDGYVIFEKKITKTEAKSWLDLERMSSQARGPEPAPAPSTAQPHKRTEAQLKKNKKVRKVI